ncbi:hypothetical protein GCM10027592_16090 [Spirosoma flavus]
MKPFLLFLAIRQDMQKCFVLFLSIVWASLSSQAQSNQSSTLKFPSLLPTPSGITSKQHQISTGSARALAATIRYVKAGATGNGSSWSQASGNLQAMINASASGDQVWIAGGTYKPGTTRSSSFSLKNGVSVLGGFTGVSGTEGNTNARTAMPSSTTLSGDIGTPNDPSDNCYHVFYHSLNGLDNTAILDGVVITGGNANGYNGSTVYDVRGGGVFNWLASPSFLNCIFIRNSASENNNGGGAFFQQEQTQPTKLINCQFIDNSSSFGKDIYTALADVDIVNCYFTGGSGGSFSIGSVNNTLNLTNCTFRSNPAGAVISNYATFNFVNCILWNNAGAGALLRYPSTSIINVRYSVLQSGVSDYTDGGNNQIISRTPFANATGPQLLPCATAIDAGNNAANSTATDVLGKPRKARTIDIGAAEFDGTPYTVAVSASATPNPVCAFTPTRLQATASNSLNLPYSYTWTAPTGTFLSNANLNPTTATATTAGIASFSILVSDAIGCLATNSVNVTVNALPTANILTPTSTTLTCSTPSLSLTATGGGTYRWDNNSTNAVRSVATGGTYSVTVTNANGCTAVDSQVISINNTAPTANILVPTSATLTCTTTALNLTATGGGTYRWNNNTTSAVRSVTAAGTYSVTVTAPNGCTASDSQVINSDTAPPTASILTPASATLSCSTPSLSLTATGGGNYRWNDNVPTAVRSVTVSGTYSVTVTAPNGCTATDSQVIAGSTTPPSATIAYAGSPFSTTAAPINVTRTGTAGGTYTASPSGLSIDPGTGQITPASSSPGNYTVTYTVAVSGACPQFTTTTTLEIQAVPPTGSGLTATPSIVCLGSSVHFTYTLPTGVLGLVNYQLTNGTDTRIGVVNVLAGNPTIEADLTPTVVGPQTFTMSVATVGIQISSASTSLTVNAPPTASLSASQGGTLTCANPSLTLTAGGGTSYTFVNGSGTLGTPGSTNTLVVNSPGTYSVIVANANGCGVSTTSTAVSSNTATILVANPATTAATLSTPFSQTFTAVGGASPLTFTLATGYLPDGLSLDPATGVVSGTPTQSGTFPVTVRATDANGCSGVSATYTLVVDVLPLTITGFTATSSSVCTGSPLTFTALIGNVTGTYNYTLTNAGAGTVMGTSSNPLFSQTLIPTSPSENDFYRLFIRANGLEANNITVVNVLFPASANLQNNGPLSCTQTSVTLTASGGSSYSFSGPNGPIASPNNMVLVSQTGLYSVTVVASNGCSATATTTVGQDTTQPTVSISPGSATLNCATSSASLSAIGTGTFLWDTGATTSSISATAAGMYSVTLTAINGCKASASAQVSQDNSVPSVSISANPSLTIANGQSTTLTANGATTYQWSTGATTTSIVVNSAGPFSVTGTTGNCSAQASVMVIQNTPPAGPFAITAVTANTCQQISANRYVISFTPVYVGTNGQPISFSVVNELFPTTAPGPYTLQLYTDNPVITLKAQQAGTLGEVSYVYNWLAACSSPQPNTPPRVNQPLTDQIARVGEGFGYTLPQVTFTDNESPQSLVVTVSGLPAGLSFTPPTQIGGVPTVAGVRSVTVTATDPQGLSVSTSFILTVVEPNAVNTPPTLVNPISAQVGIQGQPFSLNVSNTFTDAQTPNALVLTASGLPTGLTLAGTLISGTPSVSGTSMVSLTAVDPGGLSATTSFMLTIQPTSVTASAPFAITGVSPITCTQVANNRYEISFTPRYSGVNGQPINFWVLNELVPTTAPGPYSLQLYNDNPTIVLKARQEGSADESSFTYNWLASCGTPPQPNSAPRVNIPLTNQTARVGQAFGYTIPQLTFTDNETPQSLVLSVSGLPAGMSFSPPTQIGGIPSVSGVSSVTVTATDPAGLSVSTTFSLTVLPANAPVGFAITGVQTLSCVSLSAGRRSVTFIPQYSGLDSSPVSFSIVNELLPTTASGPYTLELYTDNSTLRLRAQQGGSQASYDYNWLAACSTPARIGTGELANRLQVRVLGNPVDGDQVELEIHGVAGGSVMVYLVDQQGKQVAQQRIPQAGLVERLRMPVNNSRGLLLLDIQTTSQRQQLKVLVK